MASVAELIVNSLPEIIGGLAVASIVTFLGFLFKRRKRLRLRESKSKAPNGIIKGIRSTHGVRPLMPMENGLKIQHLPNGVYGYHVPWALDDLPNSLLGLQRGKGGTYVAEIHKSGSGGLFIMGFVDQGSLIRLQNPNRTEPVHTHVFFEPYEGYVYPVSIPVDKILESDHRTVEEKFMCDMRIE
jgi:hypothetical protein